MNGKSKKVLAGAMGLLLLAVGGAMLLRRPTASERAVAERGVSASAPGATATGAAPSPMAQARAMVENGAAAMSDEEFRASLEATGNADVQRLRAELDAEKEAHRAALEAFRGAHGAFAKRMLEGRPKDDPEIVALQHQMAALESELIEISRRANARAQELATAYRDVALAQLQQPSTVER